MDACRLIDGVLDEGVSEVAPHVRVPRWSCNPANARSCRTCRHPALSERGPRRNGTDVKRIRRIVVGRNGVDGKVRARVRVGV